MEKKKATKISPIRKQDYVILFPHLHFSLFAFTNKKFSLYIVGYNILFLEINLLNLKVP